MSRRSSNRRPIVSSNPLSSNNINTSNSSATASTSSTTPRTRSRDDTLSQSIIEESNTSILSIATTNTSTSSPPRKKSRLNTITSPISSTSITTTSPIQHTISTRTIMALSLDDNDSNLMISTAIPVVKNGNGTTSSGEEGKYSDAMDYEENDLKFKPLWKGSEIDRQEFIRLTMQTLVDMGYSTTVEALKSESGFELESPIVTEFRDSVLAGKWDVVEKLLIELPSESISDLAMVKFVIRQQKFLEALEVSEAKRALLILRNELAPLNTDSDRLHLLSSLIMCGSPEDLRTRANWDGVAGDSRRSLLVELQRFISPKVMLPQRRLSTLIEQAKTLQRSKCLYHAADVPISLLCDCYCDPASFPSATTHILKDHTDEIWRLEFSHNGDWLATAGRDQTAIIWNVKNGFSLDKIFREHTDPVACVAWSPDDSILLTTAESVIKMWNTTTGTCIATLSQHEYPVGAIAWLPSGQGFVSGGMDSRVFLWDLSGNVTTFSSSSQSRVIDLAVTPDGKRLVTVGRADLSASVTPPGSSSASQTGTNTSTPPTMARNEKRLSVFNLETKKLEYEIVQPGELTSISISSDSRYAVVSHAPNEILYIDLKDGTILKRLLGHDQGQFVLHSCLGGALDNYIMSGSEDGQIYVWHRDTGNLIKVLSGHGAGSVNAVAWNKGSKNSMFGSVSDDRTVRIWEIPPTTSTKN